MKKILFYDCFTKGVGHVISPINNALPKDKFQTKLLHFESVYSPGFPKFKKIKGLDCYDFSFYKTFNIKKILEIEKPDLVIFFDKGGLIDRAGIKVAKLLKIPTLFIQHGTLSALETEGSYYSNIYSISFYLLHLRRIFKMLVIYVLASLFLDHLFFLRPKTYKLFFHLFTNPHKFYLTYSDEVNPDKLAVFSESDKEFFKQKYGYKDEEIEITGNPFLDKACLLAKKAKNLKKHSFTILYLTKPYVEDRLFGWNKNKREEFIKTVYQMTEKHQMPLVLKIHPRENIESYKSFFKSDRKIEIIQTGVDEAINKSDLVLSFYSTALFNAVILRKPIILINWTKGTFPSVDLAELGIAKRANSLSEFNQMLEEFAKRKFFNNNYEPKRAEFIKKFLYKDDGQAMKRIMNLIEKLIKPI